MKRLIIATKNKSKFKEIKKILKGIGIKIISLNDLDKEIKIKEDGKSFFENALKKALRVSFFYKDDYIVGEDSGLEVFSLKGRPGIFSRRFAGKSATDRENNLKLLKELEGKNKKERKAHFFCCVVLVKNKKLLKKFEGELKGYINQKMEGKKGFGYDPIFYLPKYKKTVAQLSLKEKNKISHRAKAFEKLKKYLEKMLHC
jgi:XTP/dITP diphosphohydrolase